MPQHQQVREIHAQIGEVLDELTETGHFPVNAKDSDAICWVIQERFSDRSDVIAILDEVLADRGIKLVEGQNGQWGWQGVGFGLLLSRRANQLAFEHGTTSRHENTWPHPPPAKPPVSDLRPHIPEWRRWGQVIGAKPPLRPSQVGHCQQT